jgi:hypothetical protein
MKQVEVGTERRYISRYWWSLVIAASVTAVAGVVC